MDSGIIARRYARALVSYCLETGGGDIAFAQARTLVRNFAKVPGLRAALDSPVGISDRKKLKLIETASGEEGRLCNELRRFVELIFRHHRAGSLPRILLAFTHLWREANGLKIGWLTTAVPAEGQIEKFLQLAGVQPDGRTEVVTKVDPEIIGGFIFEMDSHRIDASVASQIGKVRTQLIEKNRRIV